MGKFRKNVCRRLSWVIALVILLSIIPANVLAAGKRVSVELPKFPITLNGQMIDNAIRTYPFIVYKNITYVPMTYWDSRFLGLTTEWSAQDGLAVYQSEQSGIYKPDVTGKKQAAKLWARIAEGRISVNGKRIDNAKETYPLLIYNDVTYFPLTWRFMVEEFGWHYAFDSVAGLNISTEGEVIQLPITDRSWNENYEPGAWTLAGDYIYYEGKKGIIYRQSLTDLKAGKRQAVYSLPISSIGDGSSYVLADLETVDGRVWLTYHQGGAVMGSDYSYVFDADGKPVLFDSGYALKKEFGDLTVRINQRMPSDGGNLTVKFPGAEDYVPVGSPDYLYGWVFEVKDNSMGGTASRDLELVDDDIYVLGFLYAWEDKGQTTGIYKINLKTQETVRLGEDAVREYKIKDDRIYYKDWDGYLYKMKLDGTAKERLTSRPVDRFVIHGDNVYYVFAKGQEQAGLWTEEKDQPLYPEGTVDHLSVQNGYLICTFTADSPVKDKLLVLDDSGNLVFRSSVKPVRVRVDGDRVAFMTAAGPTIYISEF